MSRRKQKDNRIRPKIPHSVEAPPEDRRPRADPNLEHAASSADARQPSWLFGMADWTGPWAIREQESVWVLKRLAALETATWAEIKRRKGRGAGSGSHYIPVARIIIKAQNRLREIGVDNDELFSLRVNGKPRLWGLLEGASFNIIWWDPNHEICPTNLQDHGKPRKHGH